MLPTALKEVGMSQSFRQRFDQNFALAKENFDVFLRRSYIIIAGMIVVGIIINCILPHGWTVWPFVMALGILLMTHEAAQRNGQGVPPLQVYALFGGGILAWIIITAVLSSLNFLIVLISIGAMAYFAVKAYLVQREKDEVIRHRKENRLCVHCGEPSDPEAVYCEHCGEEPNPEVLSMRRIAGTAQTPARAARARAILTPAKSTADVRSKEAALLSRKNRPNAAKSYQGKSRPTR
jgi:hypothetical protein